MLKTYSKFLLIVTLCSISNAQAFLDQDFYLEKSFMEVPHALDEKLKKEVSFSFKDSPLSEILLLMSKLGDFNVVFPKELDKTVSIQIKEQSIGDTLEDIALLYNYNYEYKKNSIVFQAKNNDKKIEIVKLKFKSAALVLKLLDEDIAKNLSLRKDPSLNNIIAEGYEEDLRLLRNFAREIDKAEYQKIFLPEFLTYKEVKRYLRNNLEKNTDVEVKRLEPDYILISGTKDIVESLHSKLEELDQSLPEQNFSIAVYENNSELEKAIAKLEPDYQRKEFFRLDKDAIELMDQKLISTKDLKLDKDLSSELFSMAFSFSSDILDSDSLGLKFNDKEAYINKETDSAFYLIDKKDLQKNSKLKKALGINKNQDLIFVLKPVKEDLSDIVEANFEDSSANSDEQVADSDLD